MKYIKAFERIGSPDLIIAVKSGKPGRVKELLDAGVDPNCKDNMQWTPLLWATYSRKTLMIKMLIDAGADMHYKTVHHIRGTKKMVDFYDLAVDKQYYEGGYKVIIKWIENNYPEFVAAKKYNL